MTLSYANAPETSLVSGHGPYGDRLVGGHDARPLALPSAADNPHAGVLWPLHHLVRGPGHVGADPPRGRSSRLQRTRSEAVAAGNPTQRPPLGRPETSPPTPGFPARLTAEVPIRAGFWHGSGHGPAGHHRPVRREADPRPGRRPLPRPPDLGLKLEARYETEGDTALEPPLPPPPPLTQRRAARDDRAGPAATQGAPRGGPRRRPGHPAVAPDPPSRGDPLAGDPCTASWPAPSPRAGAARPVPQ